ncbi:hypothetical protein [Bradyrhizobium sp. DASA03007]|uniref:hypothetical protein n=1 Tax=unclassified Bradyrhizobium TaxID=2631580 RepID=UPI003F6F4B8E
MFELMKRFKRRKMDATKRRAIEILERDNVSAVELAEIPGSGIVVYGIRAVEATRRAQRLA